MSCGSVSERHSVIGSCDGFVVGTRKVYCLVDVRHASTEYSGPSSLPKFYPF